MIKSYIFEVRHEGNFKLLNIKGDLIELFLGEFDFKKFKNDENGIIVRSMDELSGAFVFFDRFGFSSINSTNFVADVKKFVSLLKDTGLYKNQKTLRIGCRITEAFKFKDSMDTLKNKYNEKFGYIREEALNVLDMELIDVAYPLTMKKDNYKYKILTGPIEKGQAYDFFPINSNKELDFPEVSIFSDIDCYSTNNENIDFEYISNTVEECFNNVDTKIKSIRKLVTDEK